MVYLNGVLLAAPRGLSHKTRFLDRCRVFVKGGSGGQGFPKYGGMGGDGGSVTFVAGERGNLYDFVTKYPDKRFIAGHGSDSKRMVLLGSSGTPLEVVLPPGVVLSDDSGLEIAELNKSGEKCIIAKGGKGGGPQNSFKASPGEARRVTIDLKLLADVGLVGFPNAGKSSFLKAVSKAQPKIADYPFTTLRPQLGTVVYEDGRRITVADLPGLIEGAHLNVGMGHFFLKHVERTKLLLVMVDIQGFVLNNKSAFRNAFETVILLNKELEMYKPALLEKPQLLLINKMDTDNAESLYNTTRDMVLNMSKHLHLIDPELQPSCLFNFHSVLPVSAQTGFNIKNVKDVLRQVIDESHREKEDEIRRDLKDHIQTSNTEQAEVVLV